MAYAIKGQAHNYELPALSTVALRAEDYLANVKVYPPRTLDDIRLFVESMTDIAETPDDDERDISKLVRSLPAKFASMKTVLKSAMWKSFW